MSWKARGLLAELMSYPDGWETTVDRLVEKARTEGPESEGRQSMRNAMAELKRFGYVAYVKTHVAGGRFATDIWVSDSPLTGIPETGTPVAGTPVTVSPVTGTPETGTPLERRTTKTVKKKDLIKTEAKSSSSARSATHEYLCERLKLDDDESLLLINKIKDRHHPRNMGAYLRKMTDVELCEVLADALADELDPGGSVPHCGRCDVNRMIEVEDAGGRGMLPARCPRCHPGRKPPDVPRQGYEPYRDDAPGRDWSSRDL
jgi:hypothetical protein